MKMIDIKTTALVSLTFVILAGCSKSDPLAGEDQTLSTLVATSVHTKYRHTCIESNLGTYCWGANSFSELGDKTFDNQFRPSLLSVLDSIEAISAGSSYTCGLLNQGLWCWGYNENGGLGNTTVPNGPGCNPADACYTSSAVAVMGVGGSGSLSAITGFSTGGDHSCAFDSNGSAYCWGYNNAGQLGDASNTQRTVPVQVSALTSGVTAIDVGTGDFTCALVNGALNCWGDNYYGQLADGATPTDSNIPVAAATLTSNVQDFSAGTYHACAVWSDTVWCWGSGLSGQIGDGHYNLANGTPTAVLGITGGATKVAAGFDHTCAIVNGGVQCWGANDYGQLGHGSTTYVSNSPVTVTDLTSGVTEIAAGYKYTCAIQSGKVYCWGANDHGQLGVGDNLHRDVPTPMALPLEDISEL